ncbi:MAG: hypothetical protein K9L02_02580 [Acholeplasmataceae bacterium]|nr:hypothetical protein [Acholeplasmataceae bacterium]
MKQFSIVLILVSCILGIISHILNFIGLYIEEINSYFPFSDIYVRFGELTLIIGLVGLYVTFKDNVKFKSLLLGTIIAGFFHFLIIEFGIISGIGLLSALILMIKFSVFSMCILQFKDEEMDALRIKGFVLISVIGLYCLAFLVISFITIFTTQSSPSISETVLPFFYMIYQAGLYIFFLELYREIYRYKNIHYIEL